MGSPSTRLPTGLSQLLARWSAMLQHLICPLASADRSREPVGHTCITDRTTGKASHPRHVRGLGGASPQSRSRAAAQGMPQ